ncbi:MAG: hypothetical protein Q9164_000820 [Protoblastenia rupestris]
MTGAGKNTAGRGRGKGAGPPNPSAPQQAAYDGPSEGRGRSPSQSRPGSRSGSVACAQSDSLTLKGYDSKTGKAPVLLRNVDLGGEAYNLHSSADMWPLQQSLLLNSSSSPSPIV